MMSAMEYSLPANMDRNNNDEDINYDQASALRAVAPLEGDGEVLQDHYTFEEYIYRRGDLLGQLPAYSKIANACYIARTHAADIFDDEQQLLAVEKVRERELEQKFAVLLPLPTTTNTQSIDSFKSNPPKGGIHETEDDGENEVSQSSKPAAANATHSTPATSPMDIETMNKQIQLPAGYKQARSTAAKAFPVDPNLIDLITPGLQQNATSSQSKIAKSNLSSLNTQLQAPQTQMTPAFTARQNISVDPTAVNGPPVNGSEGNLGEQDNTTAPEAVSFTKDNSSTAPKLATSPAEKTYHPHPRVASMARYGIVHNIKATQSALAPEPEAPEISTAPVAKASAPIPQPTSQTMASTNALLATTSADPEDSAEPPMKRQKRTRGVAQKVNKTAATSPAPQSKLTTNAASAKEVSTKKSKAVKDTINNKAQNHLESVIAGSALPKTKAEAATAAAEHHARLLAAHNSRKRITARQAARNTPDLLPYFFSTNNFSSSEANVRCICGCVDEDGGEMGDQMVQCEKCEVWQHYACVLPGMSEAQVEKMGEYECTVCDPWARRYVLQSLRKNDGQVDLEQ
ncbi:hypothetical protein Q7P37_006008 [Cladosporium fusiforme]